MRSYATHYDTTARANVIVDTATGTRVATQPAHIAMNLLDWASYATGATAWVERADLPGAYMNAV